MSNILITGGEGVLGSSLANFFLKSNNEVTLIDFVRKEECTRLKSFGILDQVDYIWKSSLDISVQDIEKIDMIFDCAIGFPDRPFGTDSPRSGIYGNLSPAIGLLEAVRHASNKPTLVYPSSFNALYGYSGTYNELTPTNPTSIYGWTKAAVETLYLTYYRSFGIPIIITRVGSSYGEMMRTDELVARLIMKGLRSEKFLLRSPKSKRLWTYIGDVIGAYSALVKQSDYGKSEQFLNELKELNLCLNIAGNLGDKVVNNEELSSIIGEITGFRDNILSSDKYEPGELLNGNPISFGFDAERTRKILKWKPTYSLNEGISKTTEWFRNNI